MVKSPESQRRLGSESAVVDRALALGIALLLFCYALIAVSSGSLSEVLREIFWKNASSRPPSLLIITILGWALAVAVCTKAGMNLDLILGSPVCRPAESLRLAAVLLYLFLGIHLLAFLGDNSTFWAMSYDINVAVQLIFLALLVCPFKVLLFDSRTCVWRTIRDTVLSPFTPVSFFHVLVADYLTSAAKAIADIQVTLCVSSRIFFQDDNSNVEETLDLWEFFEFQCVDQLFTPLVIALPFWWRLCQCLHVYNNTKERKNLVNALKYASAFPVIISSFYKRRYPSPAATNVWALAVLVNSCYSFSWDIVMDWGIVMWAPGWGLTMRDTLLVTPHRFVYLTLMAFNFALRMLWSLKLAPQLELGGEGGIFVFESLEVIRRSVWAIFRMEWEYIAKGFGVYTLVPDGHSRSLSWVGAFNLGAPSAVSGGSARGHGLDFNSPYKPPSRHSLDSTFKGDEHEPKLNSAVGSGPVLDLLDKFRVKKQNTM